jgi:mono/diheme cytochrome c family protein
MKRNFKAISFVSMAALAGVLTLSSCVSDSNSPGLEYMPDMYRSPSIETYVDFGEIRGVENKSLKMTQSALTPPQYTVPYHGTDSAYVMMMLPYKYKAAKSADLTHGLFGFDMSDSISAEYDASASDMNPITLTKDNYEAVLKEGKRLFMINCQHCHGEKGDGNGPMVQSGAFPGVPSYMSMSITPGQMFYSITYGKGLMGAQSPILNKKEIWTLVHYIEKLRDSKYPNFSDSTATISDSTKVKVAMLTK